MPYLEQSYKKLPNQPPMPVTQISLFRNKLVASSLSGVYECGLDSLQRMHPDTAYFLHSDGEYNLCFGNISQMVHLRNGYLNTIKLYQKIEKAFLLAGGNYLTFLQQERNLKRYNLNTGSITSSNIINSSLVKTKKQDHLIYQFPNKIFEFKEEVIETLFELKKPEKPILIITNEEAQVTAVAQSSGVDIYKITKGVHPKANVNLGEIYQISSLDSTILLSTSSGLKEYDPEAKQIIDEKYDPEVTYFFKDSKGNAWYGSQDGLNLTSTNSAYFFPNEYVHKIVQDTFENIWVLLNNKLAVYDFKEWHILDRHRDEIPTSLIRDICSDKSGHIWLGTQRYGLTELHYKDPSGNPKIGFEYVSYTYNGLRKTDSQSNTVNKIFNWGNSFILGNYSSGILSFDKKGHIYKPFLLADKDPLHNIYSIAQGSDSIVWFTSRDGFFSLDMASGIFNKINDNIYDHNYIYDVSAVLGDNLFLGYKGDIIQYSFKELSIREKKVPNVKITQVSVDGQKINRQPNNLVELKHHQNNLQFQFGLIDYFDPKTNLFRYKLEGVDEEWQEIGRQTSIQFAALNPGNYQFKVKASASDLTWGKEYTSYNFSIKTPFWNSWNFKFATIFALSILIFLYIHYRIKYKTRQLKTINEVREKAAADFHDEIGNRLARLSLFIEIIENSISTPSDLVKQHLEKLKDTSIGIYHVMKDFLWTLDPTKDHAVDLAILIKDFGEELFEDAQIRFDSNPIPKAFEHIKQSQDEKRHCLMIFKEGNDQYY